MAKHIWIRVKCTIPMKTFGHQLQMLVRPDGMPVLPLTEKNYLSWVVVIETPCARYKRNVTIQTQTRGRTLPACRSQRTVSSAARYSCLVSSCEGFVWPVIVLPSRLPRISWVDRPYGYSGVSSPDCATWSIRISGFLSLRSCKMIYRTYL